MNRPPLDQLTSLIAHLPSKLIEEANQRVRDGWVASIDDLLADALRRYLDSHSPELTEQFVLQDVEWGLYGRD